MIALFAQSELWPAMAIIGLGLIIAMLMLRGQRRRARGQDDDRSSRVSQVGLDLSRYGEDAGAQDRWEVEMHDRTREMTGTLDSKMSALQALIADADRAAARLERALDEVEGRMPDGDDSPLSDGAPLATGTDEMPVAPAPGTAGQAGSGTPAGQQEGDRQSDLQREQVHTLADYGHPPSEIAARLGRPVGEIELILRLRGTSG